MIRTTRMATPATHRPVCQRVHAAHARHRYPHGTRLAQAWLYRHADALLVVLMGAACVVVWLLSK